MLLDIGEYKLYCIFDINKDDAGITYYIEIERDM